MSLQLQPQNNFTVVRQIADHTDSTTYYVRAVIRNAYTDDIITTLNLDDKGSQRFKKDWNVSADPSGQGFYISIVTSVYTDSGYTTKSGNYGDEENTYLVADRLSSLRGGGMSSSGGLDSRTVRRIVQEELENAKPAPVEFPPMRWEEVLGSLSEVLAEAKSVPKERVDLSPLLRGIQGLNQAIIQKEVTPKTDLTPVLTAIQEAVKSNDTRYRLVAGLIEEITTTMGASIAQQFIELIAADLMQKLDGLVQNTTFTIAPTTAKMNVPRLKDREQPKTEPLDVNQLAA